MYQIYFNQREYAGQLKRGTLFIKIAAIITAAAVILAAG